LIARCLFDVNALIALVDPNHVFHDHMHAWWELHRSSGWASCSLTLNGALRVMSQPAYSEHPFSLGELARTLRAFQQTTDHEFWPEDLSLLDESRFDLRWVVGHRQITDVYLLGLAVQRQGVLVTLDTSIPVAAVCEATGSSLVSL